MMRRSWALFVCAACAGYAGETHTGSSDAGVIATGGSGRVVEDHEGGSADAGGVGAGGVGANGVGTGGVDGGTTCPVFVDGEVGQYLLALSLAASPQTPILYQVTMLTVRQGGYALGIDGYALDATTHELLVDSQALDLFTQLNDGSGFEIGPNEKYPSEYVLPSPVHVDCNLTTAEPPSG